MKKLSSLIGFKAVLVCMTQSKKEMFPGACPCHLKWDSGQDGTGEKGERGKRVILNHFSYYQHQSQVAPFLTPSTSELGFARQMQTWRRQPRQLSWRRIERSGSLTLHYLSYLFPIVQVSLIISNLIQVPILPYSSLFILSSNNK